MVAPGMTNTSVKVADANHSRALGLLQDSTQYTNDSSRLKNNETYYTHTHI
jgi:hypothetical protein